MLSLRLPSARIEAPAGSSVGCGRFSIVCPAATLPIEREAARGLLSWPLPLLLSPMERGASTLEERKPSRFSAYQRGKFPFDISKVAPLPRQGFPVFVCTKTQLAILLLCAQKYNLLFSIFELREDLLKGL